MTTLFEDEKLTDFAKVLAGWLVFSVDPGTERWTGTMTELAQHFGRHRETIRAALSQLERYGFVSHFRRGRGDGWVKITGYYGHVMYPTKLLREQQRATAEAQEKSRLGPRLGGRN